jgi:hypothetical protein
MYHLKKKKKKKTGFELVTLIESNQCLGISSIMSTACLESSCALQTIYLPDTM